MESNNFERELIEKIENSQYQLPSNLSWSDVKKGVNDKIKIKRKALWLIRIKLGLLFTLSMLIGGYFLTTKDLPNGLTNDLINNVELISPENQNVPLASNRLNLKNEKEARFLVSPQEIKNIKKPVKLKEKNDIIQNKINEANTFFKNETVVEDAKKKIQKGIGYANFNGNNKGQVLSMPFMNESEGKAHFDEKRNTDLTSYSKQSNLSLLNKSTLLSLLNYKNEKLFLLADSLKVDDSGIKHDHTKNAQKLYVHAEANNLIDHPHKNLIGTGFSFDYAQKVNDRIDLIIGFGISKYRYLFEFSNVTTSESFETYKVILDSLNFGQINVKTLREKTTRREIRHYNNYLVVNVPMAISFNSVPQKISTTFDLGVNLNLYRSAKGRVSDPNILNRIITLPNDDVMVNTLDVQLLFRGGVQYQLTQSLDISFRASYMKSLGNWRSELSKPLSPSILSLGLGLRYRY